MNAHRFGQLPRLLARGRSRRALVGCSLAASLIAALGGGEETAGKGKGKGKTRSERCVPAGRRCGTKKNDRSCKDCCHRNHTTTTGGKKKKCACKGDGLACGNPSQCCSASCQGGVCQATTQATTLSEVGTGLVTPNSADCNPFETSCQQTLSGVITSGSPIATGTFNGTITVRNFQPVGDPLTGANGDVLGSVTLTESATGAQLIVDISGRITISFVTGAFTFSGGYTITGGTGRFAGASGAGSATFSGVSDQMTGGATITSFTLSGVIIL